MFTGYYTAVQNQKAYIYFKSKQYSRIIVSTFLIKKRVSVIKVIYSNEMRNTIPFSLLRLNYV